MNPERCKYAREGAAGGTFCVHPKALAAHPHPNIEGGYEIHLCPVTAGGRCWDEEE